MQCTIYVCCTVTAKYSDSIEFWAIRGHKLTGKDWNPLDNWV